MDELYRMNDYVLLEDVADERGESPAIVGRFLFRSKCDLYLRLDESKELRTCEVKYEPLGELWTETNIVTPGHYRLLPESATEAIKRIGSDNFSIEGLIFVTKFEDGKTFNLKFGKDDSSVSIVAKKIDIDSLPPPSKYQTAPGSMYPVPPEKKIFEKFEKIKIPNKRKPHSAFVVVAKTMMKIKRGEAWKELVDLAQKSRGQTEVTLPGWGKIYLRRVRLNPEQEILYSHEQFDYDKTEKLPDGVKIFNLTAFNTSWTDYK